MTESRTRTETTFQDDVATEKPADGASALTSAVAAPPRRDRVRWGPVWAGLIVAVPTFLLLQLATLAFGWWEVGPGNTGNAADWWSAIDGMLALFLGGLTAGASAIWRGFSDGLLHGILVWALTVASTVVLSLFGGGALLGSIANVLNDVAGIDRANLPGTAAAQATDVATSSAAWALLGLGLGITAAAIGGLLGTKMWPSRSDADRQRVATG